MALGKVRIQGDLMAVRFIDPVTIAAAGNVVSDFIDIPSGYELVQMVVGSSSGGGTVSGTFASSLDILDGNDTATCTLRNVASGGVDLGVGVAGGDSARVPISTNTATQPKRLGFRVERIRGRLDVITAGCGGCFLVGIFRRRNQARAA